MQAEDDGIACVELLNGKAGHVNYNTVPGIVYTHPEVASVGLTEEQAKDQGLNYKVFSYYLLPPTRTNTWTSIWQTMQPAEVFRAHHRP